MQKSFKVLNVKCGGCANTIKEALRDEFGEVDVNLNEEPRIITLEIENEDKEALLRKKMKHLGYPFEDEENGVVVKAKSFISCAIGKIHHNGENS